MIFYILVLNIVLVLSKELHIEKIAGPYFVGEEPAWDHRTQMLYFTDIFKGKIGSYNYKTKEIHLVSVDGQATPILPTKNGVNIFLVGVNRTLKVIEWDGKDKIKSQRDLSTVSKQFPTSTFNDGKTDNRGRVWIGTLGALDKSWNIIGINEGRLYMFTKDNLDNPDVMVSPVNVSNGIAWNSANTKMYFCTTFTQHVEEYDYDAETGTVRFNRIIFDVGKYPQLKGYPDGLTIDTEDNLWVALFNGGAVVKVDSKSGELIQEIKLDVQTVTSLMFGGPDLDILFVTTAYGLFKKQEELESQPDAGWIFAITGTGAVGLPQNLADIF